MNTELAPIKQYGDPNFDPTKASPRRRSPPPKPAPAPLLPIDLRAVAYRFVDELLDAAAVEKIEAALALVAVEQRHIESHNVPVCAQKVTEANRNYSASPTKENLRLLRETKTLSPWEHGRIQLEAISRQKKIIVSKLSPLVAPLLLHAADFLDGDAKAISCIDNEHFKNYGMPAPTHALAQSLAATAAMLRTQAAHAPNSTEKSEFLGYLMEAWSDTSRVKPNLSSTRLFMPPPVEADAADAGEPGQTEVEAT